MKTKLLAAALVGALGVMQGAQAFELRSAYYYTAAGEGIVTLPTTLPLNVTRHREEQSFNGLATSRFDVTTAGSANASSLSLDLAASIGMGIPAQPCGGGCTPPQSMSGTGVALYFQLDEATRYTLEGTLFATSTGDLISGLTVSSGARLFQFVGDLDTFQGDLTLLQAFEHQGTESTSPLPFFATGVLGPGIYALSGSANTQNFSNPMNGSAATSRLALSSSNVQLSFSPVPLPGALWLLVSGIAGLAGIRRVRDSA